MGQTPPPTALWRRYTTAHRCSTLSASSSRRSADSQAPGRGAVFKHETWGYLKLFPFGANLMKASPPTVRRRADDLLCVDTSDNDCFSHKEGRDVNCQAIPSAERTGRSLRRASSSSAPGSDCATMPQPA